MWRVPITALYSLARRPPPADPNETIRVGKTNRESIDGAPKERHILSLGREPQESRWGKRMPALEGRQTSVCGVSR